MGAPDGRSAEGSQAAYCKLSAFGEVYEITINVNSARTIVVFPCVRDGVGLRCIVEGDVAYITADWIEIATILYAVRARRGFRGV